MAKTIEEIAKKWDILDDEYVRIPRKSIEDLLSVDDYGEDRGHLVHYIDECAYNNGDVYFQDMTKGLVFREPNDKNVAYTSIDRTISLFFPCTPRLQNEMVPYDNDKFRRWYFIYCHECLHQLWDTFKVGDRIKKELGSLNHTLLNVASDCVINDYLDKVNSDSKLRPIGGIFPEILKEKYGIDFDRKKDTQLTMYLKLIQLSKDQQKKLEQEQEEFDGKFTPKKIEQTDGGGGGAEKNFPPDFVRGYSQGIKDALEEKKTAKDVDDLVKRLESLDPFKNMPKEVTNKNDYEDGFKTAVEQIIKGLTEGVQTSGGDGGGEGSNLPQIPWDNLPQPKGGDGGSGGKGNDGNSDSQQTPEEAADNVADAAQKVASQAKQIADALSDKNDPNAADAQKAAARAQNAADNAKDAADNAKKCAGEGNENGAAKNLNDAINEAEKAGSALAEVKKLAGMSGSNSGSNSGSGSNNSDDGDNQEGGNQGNSQDNGDDKNSDGDDKGGKTPDGKTPDGNGKGKSDLEKAIERAKNIIKEPGIDPEGGGKRAGKTGSGISLDKLIEMTKAELDAIVNKHAARITGKIGEFVKKCKASTEVRETLLSMNSQNAKGSGWDDKLLTIAKSYVHQRLHSRKFYKKTYARASRRAEPPTEQELETGVLVTKGKKILKNRIGFDVNIYTDISGSMGGVIDKVFDAAYSIGDDIKKKFGQDKMVDKNKIGLNMFVFDTTMAKITWGQKHSVGGSTYSFHNLLEDIHARGDEAFLNIIITDGEFNGVDEGEICKIIKSMKGMVILVTNAAEKTFDSLKNKVKGTVGNKLEVIYADANFTLKDEAKKKIKPF